jgi:hypothetical protein
MLLSEIIIFNHMKHIYNFFGQNAQLLLKQEDLLHGAS